MKRRALAFFLCLVLCGALFSPCIPTARAATSIASGICGENLTWTLDSDGVLTVSGTGAMKDYDFAHASPWYRYRDLITSASLTDGLTGIGRDAFSDCTALTSITIPSSVTCIGSRAFYDCTGLTSVALPEGLTSMESEVFHGCTGLTSIIIPSSVTCIGRGAFSDCTGLTSIIIPSSVTSIENYTFYGCTGLTSVTIPTSVTSIGEAAFFRCTGLTSVTIPGSVTSMESDAFHGCTGLTGIWVDAKNPAYSSDENGVLFNKEKTRLICCPGGFSGAYVIPTSVASIGYFAFYGCTGLKSVTIPSSETSIGSRAFYDCTGLTSVALPEGLTSMESEVFHGCTGLTSVSIPSSVTSIGYSAFSGCTGLTSITIPEGVTSMESDTFYGCTGLTSVSIPSSVASIGNRVFYGCSGLTSVSIPSSVTSIGGSAFSGCTSLTGIWVDANNPVYSNNESGVLLNKEKTDLLCYPGGLSSAYVIPLRVTRIGEAAFSGCTGLTSVTIPTSVTRIGEAAFFRCTGLTSITIPSSVTSMESDTFSGCTGLTSVAISGSVTSIGSRAFSNCTGLTDVAISEGVTSIGYNAFSGCTGLKSVTIPSSVTSMEDYAFVDCTGLTSVTISEGVTSIGNSVFYGCSGLTSVSIPSSVTSIEWGAFCGCSGLTSVSFSEGLTSIGADAFYGCTGLASVTIPSSVTSIEPGAFSGCTGLTGIWVDAKNPVYSNDESGVLFNKEKTDLLCYPGGFSGAYVIPLRVTSIGACAFSGCTGLTSVIIPSSVTIIRGGAFSGCTALSGAYFCGDAPEFGAEVFFYSKMATPDGRSASGASLAELGFKIHYVSGCSGWTSPTFGEDAYPTETWCGTVCPGHDFADMPGVSNWAHKGLDFCIARGLLSGTSDTTVSPNVTMNRAMLVTVLYSLEGKPEVTAENPFTDVENDRWFSKPVIWAAANGIVSGAGNGKFNPFGNVTREQIAVMLRSYARYKAFDTSSSVELSPYPDAGSTSGWAKDALSWAVAEGLISGAASGGATYLNPKNNATRAQVATILMQFVTKVAKD